MDIHRAHQCLRQSMATAKDISNSLEKSGEKLVQIEKDREHLEHVMSPLIFKSRESKYLSECVDGALRPTLDILETMESIRHMKSLVADDPLKDIQKYLQTFSDLEKKINYINQEYPRMVECMKEAIHVAGESRVSDSYRMHVLNEAIQGLEMTSAKSFMEEGPEFMDSASERLESAFLSVLKEKSVPMDLHGEEEEQRLGLHMDLEAVGLMKIIAEKLNEFGRGQKFLDLYREVRITCLRESFKSMEPQYLRYNSAERVDRLDWHVLEGYIADWMVDLRKTVTVLVSCERTLCMGIFGTFDEEEWTKCFGDLVFKSGISVMIEFGEAVALSERQPQKLFKLLEMIEGLQKLKGDFQSVFEGSGCFKIRTSLQNLEKQLVQSSSQVLMDFGKKVQEDSGISLDGTAPKLTSYVVNYLKFLVTEFGEVMAYALKREGNTSLGEAVSSVMGSLELNLEKRAKGYTTSALAHIFLMNNYWYIFKRARDSELGSVLGEAWLKQRKRFVNQHALGYEKDEWGPLLKHLTRDGLVMSSGGRGGGKDLFKQRLGAFNTTLETIYETHKTWVISDEDLRNDTHVKIVQTLIPAYSSYIETFKHLVEQTQQSVDGKRYLRYTPEQLDSLLANLFSDQSRKGALPNGNMRRGSSDRGPVSI